MSKAQDKLREQNIYNDYDIAKKGDKVFISYVIGGRSCLPSWWAVHKIGVNLSPDCWYCHGAKTFSGKMKSDAFNEALKYASKLTGCSEWIKTPFGGFVSKITADKVGLVYKY